jgi:hypothetical protein
LKPGSARTSWSRSPQAAEYTIQSNALTLPKLIGSSHWQEASAFRRLWICCVVSKNTNHYNTSLGINLGFLVCVFNLFFNNKQILNKKTVLHWNRCVLCTFRFLFDCGFFGILVFEQNEHFVFSAWVYSQWDTIPASKSTHVG